jgi:hypothetical protein
VVFSVPMCGEFELDRSRPIRWDRRAGGAASFWDHLELELANHERRQRRRKGVDQSRFRATLEAFVLDLLVEADRDSESWLAYSRRREDYSATSRYQNSLITRQAVCDVADLLVQAGLAQGRPGFFDRSHYQGMVKVGRRSRLRAQPALVELATAFGVTADRVDLAGNVETILLRGPKTHRDRAGELVEYDDTPETLKMRSSLAKINEPLASASIGLARSLGTEVVDVAGCSELGSLPIVDRPPAGKLYRIFNDGRFDRGGRFYGGWWQSLGKCERANVHIDGEKIVELDFSGMHPRLCYALSGRPLETEVDPYAVPGFERDNLRELVKRGFGQLLNGTAKTARPPAGCKDQLPKGASWKQLLAAIEGHHHEMRDWLRVRRGLELQALDAAIAEQVLTFLAHQGIPCLPVHDSFLVARSHEAILGQTMILAWRGQVAKCGGLPGMPRIHGWSSPEVAEIVVHSITS